MTTDPWGECFPSHSHSVLTVAWTMSVFSLLRGILWQKGRICAPWSEAAEMRTLVRYVRAGRARVAAHASRTAAVPLLGTALGDNGRAFPQRVDSGTRWSPVARTHGGSGPDRVH